LGNGIGNPIGRAKAVDKYRYGQHHTYALLADGTGKHLRQVNCGQIFGYLNNAAL